MVKIHAMYAFAFKNINTDFVSEEKDGNVLVFDSKEKFMLFMVDNNFKIHELGNHALIVTREEEPNIYGRILIK